MKAPIVIIGIGELGAVIARGLLRLGHPIYPIMRAMDSDADADADAAGQTVPKLRAIAAALKN